MRCLHCRSHVTHVVHTVLLHMHDPNMSAVLHWWTNTLWFVLPLFSCDQGITHKLKWNQTIRGAPGRAAAAGNLSSPSLHTLLRTARGSSNGHGGTDDDVAAGSTAGTFSAVPPVAPGVPGSQFWQQVNGR